VIIDAVVARFDESRGDGVLVDDAGQEFYFHCVHIADGTRTIAPGTSVRARRVVGLRGRDEASDVVKR
jgi:cold shock CspA family protein